jgi:hypothetical protein
MKNRDILDFSKKTKTDAVDLLNQTNLINILSKLGKVIIGGSLNMMLCGEQILTFQ